MTILWGLVIISFLAGLIVAAVSFLLVPGIDRISVALNLGSKARGQILGYATSTPELVIVLAAAYAGVFDAGFWNIASSNIINYILFLSAVLTFRQAHDLKERTFIDEQAFALISVAIPLVMHQMEVQGTVPSGLFLLGLFVVYKILDRYLNPQPVVEEKGVVIQSRLYTALFRIILGVGLIVIAAWFLGGVTENLVVDLGVPAWLIGWLLGLTSSIPEMSGFFEIYRKYKHNGLLKGIDDTQEALDALVASNMSNLGIILPLGVFVLALVY